MSKETLEDKDPNRALRVWTKISDETGIKVEMIGHIHRSITKKRKKEVQISSKNATDYIIIDLINNDNGNIKDILTYNGIKSSEDFGHVVKRLCDEGVLIKEEADNYDDFNGHFTLGTIDQFIKNNKLKKDRDWYKTFSNSLYAAGFGIVVLSYLTQIPNEIGWFGWGFGMLGWILLRFRNKIETNGGKILNKIGRIIH